jgi:hypothetical protein
VLVLLEWETKECHLRWRGTPPEPDQVGYALHCESTSLDSHANPPDGIYDAPVGMSHSDHSFCPNRGASCSVAYFRRPEDGVSSLKGLTDWTEENPSKV